MKIKITKDFVGMTLETLNNFLNDNIKLGAMDMIPYIHIERYYEEVLDLFGPVCLTKFNENMYGVSVEIYDKVIACGLQFHYVKQDRDVSNETLKLLDKYGFEYEERE